MHRGSWRVGKQIKAEQVRVVDEDGKQLGVFSLHQALKIAEEKGLDLVEIVPDANPPVCKIVDFGKFLYEQKKREKEAKKKHKVIEVKEMYFSPTIQEHDITIKVRKIKEWLSDSSKVKISVRGVGREGMHAEVMNSVMSKILSSIEDFGIVEKQPYKEGRNLVCVVAPNPKKVKS